MTYGAFKPRDFDDGAPRARPKSAVPQAVLCALSLVASASIGLWLLYADPAAAPIDGQASTLQASPRTSIPRAASRVALRSSSQANANHSDATLDTRPKSIPRLTWFDPALTTATLAGASDQTLPLGSDFHPLQAPAVARLDGSDDDARDTAANEKTVEHVPTIVAEIVRDIPLPLPRPAFALGDVPARQQDANADHRKMALLTPQTEAPQPGTINNPGNFFQRVFGGASQRGPALAYAAPDEGGLGPAWLSRGAPDRWTAVYNIATHTVTLPSGTRLEAHSGLGSRMDDPRSITEHMRGATPPNVYDLTLREALFHGVRALRLTPTGGTTYGREGLLAHTFMLGPRGDSNGCVVFKNYAAFLQAYDSGAIRRLVVVTGS